MKKILLSAVALATLTTMATAGEGTEVKSKVPVLKFSGKHYLGFVSSETDGEDRINKFETRRNYFQVKAYFKDNPKSYMRTTLDTHQIDDSKHEDSNGDTVGKDMDGTWNVRLKYAFLYLDNVLPNTGIELGQVHRPWIDNEEHGGWNYRSISKVYVEADKGAHLTNSADLGFNLKTKTENFSSELGLFNGEGYHNDDNENEAGLSAEWRLTGHILGGGKSKAKKKNSYANVSFFGQQNQESGKHKNEDLNWMGLHAVYNQPAFLLAGQYITVDDGHTGYKGDGYSINGEYRFAKKWNAIGRYDFFDMDDNSGEKKRAIAGVTYQYNKNVEFIANYLGEGGSAVGKRTDAVMLTTEINW
ncbi:hypothetical protein GSY74_07555 [Sulfurovum sp. bin170]|uniref:hypothetical protein n=1 Tax=Sulfurovum sp. bin170 TaxID=2695268 RepID=UPI0013E0B417|nr:hypothetical protein [Sulfurovum sp. bin170]NEW61134.1 hypothetical protein [Sulfurovum sp. bin170]